MKEAQVIFDQVQDDLSTANKWMSHHCDLLTQYGECLCELQEINHDLISCVAVLEEEGCVHKV